MGKAGRVLKQVLETYGISQNKLAVTMGIERTVVYRWTHERTDPGGDTITLITVALNQLNSKAAQTFVDLYLGEIIQGDENA
ncbi:helix-turn-helix transcriptional regulator [Nodosilinea sp. LEGE 06152]|uniref:helix-turn-helix domain-containing protein n=1 Tax=Nodosilinea sp. LEGE 06152 TaxID=2777966 RepID=UPI00188091DD|nr:helix-turn-helix transcriptional regulator [Nodosilinea sp. LEGE 06152]MBE9158505.1 helix-turn-helix transcriptional regulator [Nodosilinea sp. LEGE 06152]